MILSFNKFTDFIEEVTKEVLPEWRKSCPGFLLCNARNESFNLRVDGIDLWLAGKSQLKEKIYGKSF